MSEMELTADHVIVVGRGHLLRDQSMAAFIGDAGADIVRVRSPDARELADLLVGDRVTVREVSEGVLDVTGLSTDDVGLAAAAAQLTLLELSAKGASLEEAYMALTEDSVEFHSHGNDKVAA
jgi:ABC-2 type transport system ATP-binding protein